MSEDMKPATLEPVNDEEVTTIAGRLIGAHHTTLVDANIRYLWALNKPATKWGQVKVLSEETWWLSGGLDSGGVDISVQLNRQLWKRLTEHGRTFLLDHYLSLVTAKESGKTEMDTVDGMRKLYEADKPSLTVHAAVLARNPMGLREIDEVEKVWRALSEPAQFLLDLEAADEEDEDEEDEEPQSTAGAADPAEASTPPPAPVNRPRPVPVPYYQRQVLSLEGDPVPVVLRFSDAAKLSSQLTGVHMLPPADPSKPFDGIVHNGTLEYDDDPATIRRFRQALEDALEDRKPVAAGTADLAAER